MNNNLNKKDIIHSVFLFLMSLEIILIATATVITFHYQFDKNTLMTFLIGIISVITTALIFIGGYKLINQQQQKLDDYKRDNLNYKIKCRLNSMLVDLTNYVITCNSFIHSNDDDAGLDNRSISYENIQNSTLLKDIDACIDFVDQIYNEPIEFEIDYKKMYLEILKIIKDLQPYIIYVNNLVLDNKDFILQYNGYKVLYDEKRFINSINIIDNKLIDFFDNINANNLNL